MLRRGFAMQGATLAVTAVLMGSVVGDYRGVHDRRAMVEVDLIRLEELRSEVLSAETSLRGYVLVHQEPFLEPYRAAEPLLDRHLEALRASRAHRDPRIDHLEQLLADWRTHFAEPVLSLIANGREDTATGLVGTGLGKARIDQVRARVDELVDDDRATMAALGRQQDLLMATTTAGLVAGGAALALVAMVLVQRLDRSLARPMAELADTAGRIGDGDLSARTPVTGTAEVVRTAGAFNDMADRLERTVDELRQLDRMKDELMSVVSHELRTPLTSIRGSMGLLSSGAFGALGDDASELVDIAVTNTDRLIRLINDILDLERMSSGRAPLSIAPCLVTDLVRAAVAGVAGAATDAGIDIVVQPVEVELAGDADRIVQALTNLLANAIKFSDRGRQVVVDVAVIGSEVAIRVIDTGRGIPPERLDRVFERFEQVDASDARDKGGTGLGLPITRQIAQQHEGRITVASVPGRGSTFTLWLPLPACRLGPADTAGPAGPHVIVVVEDDTDLARVICSTLGRHGMHVTMARGAAEAVALSHRLVPDLLVLDVGLTQGDGFQVVAELADDVRLQAVPVVVFTGRDLDEDDRARLRLGPTEFLTKGRGDVTELEARVLGALGVDPAPVPA